MSANSSFPTIISAEAPAISSDSPKLTEPPAVGSKDRLKEANPDTTGTKSEAEKAADQMYEERMEEEYAKREGGA